MTYVDKFGPAVAFVKQTAKILGIESEIRVVKSDAFTFMTHIKEDFDYIFAGPPYGLPTLDSIPDVVFEQKLLRKDGLLVLEHNPNHHFEQHPFFWQKRSYGKTIFSFFCYPDSILERDEEE